MIPPRFLDEIRNRLTLSDIIGRRVKVTRAGREFKACCPFHSEKTPSFTINDDKQFYHCFGCGAHGDVLGFVMQHDNLSFIDAIEMLSSEAGLQMPKPDPEAVKKAEKAKDLHTLVESATKWFEENLHAPGNEKIVEYLLGRGLTKETLSAFRVGFAPEDRQAMRTYLKSEGHSDEEMIESGVLRPSGKSGEPYAFFRNRVMFPVLDRRGRPVAFGGRILPDHMRAPDRGDYTPAKYMNSSDTPLFDKGRMLYGESLARQAVGADQPIIVTEGYMDVIACHQAGFKGAVAPMGTALTEDQLLLLWKMIPSADKMPILCFDGDNAGRRAASRSCERVLPLLKPGQSLRFAFLPDGEDPDTLIRKGGSLAFQKILDSSLTLFDFIWGSQMGGRNIESPELRAGVVKNLENQIKEIADGDVQRHYRELLRTKVSETFFSSFRGKKAKKSKSSGVQIRRPIFKRSDVRAQIFLATIINHPGIFPACEEVLGRYDIANQSLSNLRQSVVNLLMNDSTLDTEGLRTYLKEEGFDKEVGDILNESVYVHASFSSPLADSLDVKRRLMAWLDEAGEKNWEEEIHMGWKAAFQSSSEDEEEKLREMMRMKLSETR